METLRPVEAEKWENWFILKMEEYPEWEQKTFMVPILGVPGTSISNLKTKVDMSSFYNRTLISPVKPCGPIPYLAVEPGMKQRLCPEHSQLL